MKNCRTSPCGIAQSGMSPGWSLSRITGISKQSGKEFQWAVARMVTLTVNGDIGTILEVFQWAIARMVTLIINIAAF
ncbi:MAG: hypothetical protein IPJ51_21320 [Saprospiraceae bacterium]|nr:hypothetical protein [Saprospiraceae bacterium]